MGVSQNQKVIKIPKNCPTSRKNTLSTPSVIPRPSAKIINRANNGNIARKGKPGKLPEISKNTVNSVKIMEKFTQALATTMMGKQIRGKLSFLSTLAFLRKTFCPSLVNSANRPHVNMPAHR